MDEKTQLHYLGKHSKCINAIRMQHPDSTNGRSCVT